MVLEATYLCVDNSDYMRNGDFAPSRMEAQQDAVNLLAGAKTQVCAAFPSAPVPLRQLPSLTEASSRAAPLGSPAHAASLAGGLWIAFRVTSASQAQAHHPGCAEAKRTAL